MPAASRSSLDNMSPAGSCVGSLPAHRRGLNHSPHPWKHQNYRNRAYSGDELVLGTSAPTIESPLSPSMDCASLPPLHITDAERGIEGLRIEELSPNDEAFFEVIAAEEAVLEEEEELVSVEEPETPKDRPSHLDLFSGGQPRKPNYQFHSNS